MKKLTTISIIILLLITSISIISVAEKQNISITQDSENPFPEQLWNYTIKVCGIKNVTSILDPTKIVERKVVLKKDEVNIVLTRKCDNTVYQASYTRQEGKYLIYYANVLAIDPAHERGHCNRWYTATYNSYFIDASSNNYYPKQISMIVGYGTQPFFERTIELYENPNSNTNTKLIMFNFLIFRFLEPFLQMLNIRCGLAC
jgi:hypothetical protein